MSRLVYAPKNINNTPANPFEIQNLTVLGNASIAGSLSAGATTLSTLSAGGTAQLNNANIAGTLAVGGVTTLQAANVNSLTTVANASIGGTLTSVGNLRTNGQLRVDLSSQFVGDVVLNSALAVTGTSSLGAITNTTINSSGLGTFNSLSVTTNATITGTGTAATLYETQAIVTATQAAYLVTSTDRVVKLVTTGAGGPFLITFPNITTRNRVTIIMTAFNTSAFTTDVLITGSTFTWAGVGDVATFVNLGSGVWYLDGAGISNAP
jgi:hypothetical protein